MIIPSFEAAFIIAFNGQRSPDIFEKNSDEQLIPRIQKAAPGTSDKDALAAAASVRQLCQYVYKIADAFREGKFGAEPENRKKAIKELAQKNPGFSEAQYREAFSAGLFWTAF